MLSNWLKHTDKTLRKVKLLGQKKYNTLYIKST